jgi:hypothetical protein
MRTKPGRANPRPRRVCGFKTHVLTRCRLEQPFKNDEEPLLKG